MITANTRYGDAILKFWTFPAGERGVRLEGWQSYSFDMKSFSADCNITVKWDGSDDLVDLLLVNDAMREVFGKDAKIECTIPYFPYARQDRVMQYGESHSLRVFAGIVRSCGFSLVKTTDPHSDVLASLFGPGELEITKQEDVFVDSWIFNSLAEPGENYNVYLVAPDAGALKKVYNIAKITKLPVILANKVRDVETGEITHTAVEDNHNRGHMKFIVVDDIVDGGRTFIELAKSLKSVYRCDKLVLWSSHGIYSKGLDVLTDDYDFIATANNMSKFKLPQPNYNIFKDN